MASTESASAAARTLPTLPVLASLLLAVAALACVEPAPVAPALPSSTAASAPVAPGRSTLLRDGGPNIEALEEQLRGLAKDAPERPRIVRRLADACVALEDRARRDKLVHDLRHDADPRADAEAVASKRAAEAVEGARRAAIRYYRVLAREYPAWCSGHGQDGGLGCGDEVLSHLAYELEEGHEMEDAYQAHRELITTFPQSRFVPLAYLALAEPLFEAAQRDPARAPLAEKAYQEVLRFPPPENRSAGIAHYKLAYVRWSRGDLAGALAEMTKAIEVCEAFPSPSGAQLAGAARREITALYAAAGDPRGAVAFFSRLSGNLAGESTGLQAMLAALAERYLDRGKPADEAALDLDWLAHGAGAKTCALVARIDLNLASKGLTPEALARLQREAAASASLQAARAQCAKGP